MDNGTQKDDLQKNKPTHTAKIRYGRGRNAIYERIGVAWVNQEDGSVFVKLAGKQVVDAGFMLYPIEEA